MTDILMYSIAFGAVGFVAGFGVGYVMATDRWAAHDNDTINKLCDKLDEEGIPYDGRLHDR